MMVDREVMFGVLPGMDNRSDRHLPWLSLILYSAVQQRRRYTANDRNTDNYQRQTTDPDEHELASMRMERTARNIQKQARPCLSTEIYFRHKCTCLKTSVRLQQR